MIVNCGVKSWKRQRFCSGTLHDDDDDGRAFRDMTGNAPLAGHIVIDH